MKKLLSSLFLLILFLVGSQKANALKYDEAVNQSKPMAIFIYAPWADNYNTSMQAFNAMGQKYGSKYNFVTMNIATSEAKTFNQKFYIYPNLPYVLLFRNNGKIVRYLKDECINDQACFSSRLDFFNN